MTLPANVRVNTLLPFPSQVIGAGPISVTKANGIWTISISFTGLQQQNPTALQMGTDFVLVWDSIAGDFFIYPVSQVVAKRQRAVISGPVTVLDTDQQLNLNLTSPQHIPLPSYASRFGVPLVFKDVGMQATANPIEIDAFPGEFIDTPTQTSVTLNVNNEAIELTPFNDGVNAGWIQT